MLLMIAQSIGHSTPKSTLFPLDTHTIPGRNDIEAEAVRHLLAALPTEQDVRILLRESARTSVYTTLINTQQHSELTLEKLAPPYPTADIPGPHLHPILLAKCMLTFAIALQSPGGEEFLGQISETPRVLSRRLVATATTWVTVRTLMGISPFPNTAPFLSALVGRCRVTIVLCATEIAPGCQL